MQITARLKEVAKLVGIELLDHVILAKEGYYSFSDEGLL
jgi:DNA repair protein RadC